jgi:hypothetical protein
MSKRAGIIFALLLIGALAIGCNRPRGVVRVVTAEGEILTVDGQYTLVVLSQDVMRQTFGPDWHRLSLFYGSNRAITQDGQRGMIDSPLRPLAKGTPILVISGDDWSDLIVPIYALEQRKQAIFAIDTIKGTIKLNSSPGLRGGEPMVTPEGRLLFR